MNICCAVPFLILVLQTTLAYHVRKGKHSTSKVNFAIPSKKESRSSFVLCEIEDIKFKAKFFYVSLKKNNIKMSLEATRGDQSIATYEIEDYTIDPEVKGKDLESMVKQADICSSFSVEKRKLVKDDLNIIKFKNGEELWCDVYKGYQFDYKEMDKCTVLYGEYDAIGDAEYNSVDLQTKTSMGDRWKPCLPNDLKSKGISPKETHCIKNGFKMEIEYYCNEENKLGYKVTNFYNEKKLSTYTISNSNNLKEKLNPGKVCRLFRFSRSNNSDKRIQSQFLNDGEWYCETFLLKGSKHGKKYNKTTGFAKCKRFRDYDRPN